MESETPKANERSVEGGVSEDACQETTTLRVDTSRVARYTCRKYKQPHGAKLYVGFLTDPIQGPNGDGKYFISAVFLNKRDAKGRKHRIPLGADLFRSQRKASDTALLWYSRLCGLGVQHLIPGHISSQERRKLLTQLNGRRQSMNLTGPAPRLFANEDRQNCQERAAEQESGGTESEAAVKEPDGIGAEAISMPEAILEDREEAIEPPISSWPWVVTPKVAHALEPGREAHCMLQGI